MSSVHQRLIDLNRKGLDVYMSSILLRNENVPLFEEYFGQLDYDWLLRLSENRKWAMLEKPTVVRYMTGKNLSLDPEYRKRDFYMAMLRIDGNIEAMKRLCGSRARYFYYVGNPKMARYYFRQANINLKTVLYYLTSYVDFLRKLVVKKFKVFG